MEEASVKQLRLAIGALAAFVTMTATAQEPYRALAPVTGTIRIWGHPYMAAVVRHWAEGFEKFHPAAKVEAKLMGSDTAIPGLYSGNADIALMGRENNVIDDMGFARPKQYKFTRLELMNGSLDVPGKSDALVVFVHKDNPLARLTLAELDAIAGCERRRGHAPVGTWGDLGVGGEWATQPIRIYMYDAGTGTGRFFQHAVLADSRKMNWDRITEYKDRRRYDRSVYRAGEQILDALRGDRFGMAIASLRFASSDVKPIAIARDGRGPFVLPTRESVITRAYPLGRPTYAFVDVPPGKPMDPNAAEFLRYALSREGQADVERDRGYLPLDPRTLAEQRAALP